MTLNGGVLSGKKNVGSKMSAISDSGSDSFPFLSYPVNL